MTDTAEAVVDAILNDANADGEEKNAVVDPVPRRPAGPTELTLADREVLYQEALTVRHHSTRHQLKHSVHDQW